ncbi:lysozyme family protein [Streptomyces phaeolivaceus]|uniref:hypothetical protein n=1 Tax=Streptomyces phaeolivaceus TaxID=2653200 RepID=UPI001D04C553|nr:hypothetical protein [Streptomyces phaeolivaceus]
MTAAGGGLDSDQVPAEYMPWALKADAMCDVIEPAVNAARIEADSDWNPNAKSPVAAEWLSRFMPGTWVSRDRASTCTSPSGPLLDGCPALRRGDAEGTCVNPVPWLGLQG